VRTNGVAGIGAQAEYGRWFGTEMERPPAGKNAPFFKRLFTTDSRLWTNSWACERRVVPNDTTRPENACPQAF
jgi:hypothetical protein